MIDDSAGALSAQKKPDDLEIVTKYGAIIRVIREKEWASISLPKHPRQLGFERSSMVLDHALQVVAAAIDTYQAMDITPRSYDGYTCGYLVHLHSR